ncbi:ArsR/SmtB family transcription factor [Virgibacillus litoralis]|uniref:DNA-binding transcriptional ArsR family regulator n=1 Tax=Virgibacillus litoralis TaxID=578221 RepID=A0ABS4HIW3_9BACI|nr:metalloregulator ArsR/SmtB family transcription factor [Virgibacillus litoralis]MBP1950674.1 DNA-binding transcriptional ArsR family regulator [Virgibacillus litoralis]
MPKDICEVTCIHEDKVERVKQQIDQQPFEKVTTIYKLLADKNRLQIAYALLIEEELCVCDIANIIGATTATTSHHVRQLNKAGIASFRKDGKLVYYSLYDSHIKQLISQAFSHMKEDSYHAV